MDEQLKRIISIESIPGETAEQQADRLSIDDKLGDASVKYRLEEIYSPTLGTAASMDNVVKTLTEMIDNPTKSSDDKVEQPKIEDVPIQPKEEAKNSVNGGTKTMAETNNMFSNLQGTEALKGANNAAPKATKAQNAEDFSESLLEQMKTEGISVEQVKALYADKNKLESLTGGKVKVEKYYAVKEPAFDRLEDYTADNVKEAYSLGQTTSGRLGYLVRPTQKGDFSKEKLAERIEAIKAEVLKNTGFVDGATPSADHSHTNPQHIKNLINILDSATALGDNETPDTYKGIIPDDKLSNHPGKILVGNNVFLADTDAASKTWAYKAVELSDSAAVENVDNKQFHQLSFPAAGSYLRTNGISWLYDKEGKSAIVLKDGKRKVNGVEQKIDTISIDGRKDISRSMRAVVAKVGKKKVGYIRVDAKLLQPITYFTENSKGKQVTKKLKIKVYAKVYSDYELTSTTLNPCLKVAQSTATGTGRATSSMLSDFGSGNVSMASVFKMMKRLKKQGIAY